MGRSRKTFFFFPLDKVGADIWFGRGRRRRCRRSLTLCWRADKGDESSGKTLGRRRRCRRLSGRIQLSTIAVTPSASLRPWRGFVFFVFFLSLLGLQPDGAASRVRRPARPPASPGHSSRPSQTKPSVRRPACTNNFVQLTTEEHMWLPMWSADNRTMASSPVTVVFDVVVIFRILFHRLSSDIFIVLCLSFSLLFKVDFFLFFSFLFFFFCNLYSSDKWAKILLTFFWKLDCFWGGKFECTRKNCGLSFFFRFCFVFSASAPQKTSFV